MHAKASPSAIRTIVQPLEVGGWLTRAEGDLLERLARECPAHAVIVEIGSNRGKSTIRLATGSAAGNGAQIFAVDPHLKGSYDAFIGNLQRSGADELVVPMRMTSEEAAKSWTQPIGVLFIDGNHDYDFVDLDFRLWFPHLIEGGVVAFHDSTACLHARLGGYPGVRRVVAREIFRSGAVRGADVVDTITVARKGAPEPGLGAALRRARVWLRKALTDAILLANHYVLRHLRPVRGFQKLAGAVCLAEVNDLGELVLRYGSSLA